MNRGSTAAGTQMTLGMQRPLVIGVGGCSGSGKTTLAHELVRQLGGTMFPLDIYYRELGHLPPEERAKVNFDDPSSVEDALMVAQLKELMAGREIVRHPYDFAANTRDLTRAERVTPGAVILVEGIFALYYESLRGLYDFSIYVDCPEEICFMRRLARDVKERGRSPELVREQYEKSAKPGAAKFVKPFAKHARLVVDATGSIDWSVEQAMVALAQAGVLQVLQ